MVRQPHTMQGASITHLAMQHRIAADPVKCCSSTGYNQPFLKCCSSQHCCKRTLRWTSTSRQLQQTLPFTFLVPQPTSKASACLLFMNSISWDEHVAHNVQACTGLG